MVAKPSDENAHFAANSTCPYPYYHELSVLGFLRFAFSFRLILECSHLPSQDNPQQPKCLEQDEGFFFSFLMLSLEESAIIKAHGPSGEECGWLENHGGSS